MWANADKCLNEVMNECDKFEDVELQLDSEPQKGASSEYAEAELSQKPVEANSRSEKVNSTVQPGHSREFLTNLVFLRRS